MFICIGFQALSIQTFSKVLNAIIMIFYIAFIVFVLLFTPVFLCFKRNSVAQDWLSGYETFFERYWANSLLSLLFSFFYFSRRLGLAIIITYFREDMMVGCAFILILSLTFLFYLLTIRPYNFLFLNIMAIINELFIFINSFFLFFFVRDHVFHEIWAVSGWILMTMLIVLIIGNIIVIITFKI